MQKVSKSMDISSTPINSYHSPSLKNDSFSDSIGQHVSTQSMKGSELHSQVLTRSK